MAPTQSTRVVARKKLWEIDENFGCATIGSCLNRGEMRKLANDRTFSLDDGAEDYLLHSQFLRIAKTPDQKGKALHRYLEKKYRQETRKYFLVESADEIERLWRQDVEEGRLDSAWWAVMTHPLVPMELVGRMYGQLHMLAHDGICHFHRKKRMTGELKEKVAFLEEVLVSERQAYLREKRSLKEEVAALRKEIDANTYLHKENRYLRQEVVCRGEELESLRASGAVATAAAENDRIAALQQEVDDLRLALGEATACLAAMTEEQTVLATQRNELGRELESLEQWLLRQGGQEDPCESCNDQDTCNCPGRSLCGRTILYVGGITRMVPHYRQLVETLGGRFIHHDGGREASRNLLPKMLSTADAVFCPIDCISHDACNCVKKMCSRVRKPFVLMRSASLSSLAKGLTEIVQ